MTVEIPFVIDRASTLPNSDSADELTLNPSSSSDLGTHERERKRDSSVERKRRGEGRFGVSPSPKPQEKRNENQNENRDVVYPRGYDPSKRKTSLGNTIALPKRTESDCTTAILTSSSAGALSPRNRSSAPFDLKAFKKRMELKKESSVSSKTETKPSFIDSAARTKSDSAKGEALDLSVRILCVEDNEMNRRIFDRVMKRVLKKVEITYAFDGEKCLDIVNGACSKGECFDMIFMVRRITAMLFVIISVISMILVILISRIALSILERDE